MNLKLEPYVGVGPLRFGMSENDVLLSLGKPTKEGPNRRGELTYLYSTFNLVFAKDEGVVEIAFYPGAQLEIDNISMFQDASALEKLIAVDSQVKEYVGILLFPSLGVTLSGFHNEDSETVTAFAKGRLDHLVHKFKPFKV